MMENNVYYIVEGLHDTGNFIRGLSPLSRQSFHYPVSGSSLPNRGDFYIMDKVLYHNKNWLQNQYVTLGKSAPNIASYCNVKTVTIYRWLQRFAINSDGKYRMQVCQECGKLYKATLKKGIAARQKFCSKTCQLKNFHKRHPNKQSEYQHKSHMKKPLFCRYCGKPIPVHERKNGCSYHPQCARMQAKKIRIEHYNRISSAYRKMKESIGCQICGYNQYGGSLDWHHLFHKDRRISSSVWWCNSESTKKELEGCVLLCKNCHHWLHGEELLEDEKIKLNGDVYERH